MHLKQFYLGCLAHASYIIIDESTKSAVVIDPQRDIDQYLAEAEAHGATIDHVLLTHFHADFLAGHLELRERTNATIHLGARATADYAFEPMGEGDELVIGDVRLVAMETPGHTPEGISILLYDRAKNADVPEAVFTGDTLFVGDVGRPDLMASVGVTAMELAGWLYDSLRNKLMTLPDETTVYPAHGAGSMCGKNLSSETFSTIGKQKATNHALQPMDREAFQELVSTGLAAAPAYFAFDADQNRRERATLDTLLDAGANALSLGELQEFVAERGAQILDVRHKDAFAEGHLKGALNVGLGGKFATWAGAVLDLSSPVVLITEPGDEAEATMRLGRIGFDHVLGFLEGGHGALASHPDLVATSARCSVEEAGAEMGGGLVLLDIRGPGEWDAGHAPGATHLPLPELGARLDELGKDDDLAIVCKSGYRSSLAASLLRREGFTRVRDVVGGMDAWAAAEV